MYDLCIRTFCDNLPFISTGHTLKCWKFKVAQLYVMNI